MWRPEIRKNVEKFLANEGFIYCKTLANCIRIQESLLIKVPRLSKCMSAWVSECPSAQVPECQCAFKRPKWPSAHLPWVPLSPSLQMPFECPSAQVPLEGPRSDLKAPVELFLSAQFLFECSPGKESLQHYKKCNRVLKNFKNFSEYILCVTLIVFSFLGIKMCKFYHVLLTRCNDSTRFQKLSLNIL